jgi:hypothetical protein
VRFPPGCARLAASPLATGSVSKSSATMGILCVACLATCTAGELEATSTSTGRRTNSAAWARSRSSCAAAHRYSMAMVWPSTQPRACRACWNASLLGLGPETSARNPILGTLAARCASAASDTARMPRARVTMNPRVWSRKALSLLDLWYPWMDRGTEHFSGVAEHSIIWRTTV